MSLWKGHFGTAYSVEEAVKFINNAQPERHGDGI